MSDQTRLQRLQVLRQGLLEDLAAVEQKLKQLEEGLAGKERKLGTFPNVPPRQEHRQAA